MSYYTILKTPQKGFCVFSNKVYLPGENIGVYLSPKKNEHGREIVENLWETILGRYCNHNLTPNTKIIQENDSFSIVAKDIINVGDEITTNYIDVSNLLNLDENRFLSEGMDVPQLFNYGHKGR